MKETNKPREVKRWVNIVYTGTIYEENQDPTQLFEALAELIKDGEVKREHIGVDFYGDTSLWLQKEIERHGLVGVAIQHGRVSVEESKQKQREARILWLLRWEDKIPKYGFRFKVLCWLIRDKELLEYAKDFDCRVGGRYLKVGGPSKIFEYMAACRPIIVTGGAQDEILDKMLDDTQMGAYCGTVKDIKDFIRDIY